MARDKTIIAQTPPSLAKQPQVDFRKPDFEAAIQQKGYRVYHEKMIECACKDDTNGNQPLSSCKNCGGSGLIFVNKIQTRMIITSINVDTKYKEWSKERVGSVAVTARDVDRLSFMDRITLIDGQSEFSQVLHPQIIQVDLIDKLVGFTFYDIEQIEAVFLFQGNTTKLKLLENITDYTYQYNRIVLNEQYNDVDNPTVTIRYKYKPEFLVIDIPRDIMNSPVINKQTGYIEEQTFPIHAMAQRAHYVIDQENYSGDRVFDNSYHSACATETLTKFEKLIKNSEISDIYENLTDSQKQQLINYLILQDQFSVITAQSSIYT